MNVPDRSNYCESVDESVGGSFQSKETSIKQELESKGSIK